MSELGAGQARRLPPSPPTDPDERVSRIRFLTREFADDVMDNHIGRSAHRHSLLGQTFRVCHRFGYPCRIVDTGWQNVRFTQDSCRLSAPPKSAESAKFASSAPSAGTATYPSTAS